MVKYNNMLKHLFETDKPTKEFYYLFILCPVLEFLIFHYLEPWSFEHINGNNNNNNKNTSQRLEAADQISPALKFPHFRISFTSNLGHINMKEYAYTAFHISSARKQKLVLSGSFFGLFSSNKKKKKQPQVPMHSAWLWKIKYIIHI